MARHDVDPRVLETLDDPAALNWAAEWSEATENAYPREALCSTILAAVDADDRIPYVARRGDFLYNFWRNGDHPRGLWRRTTLNSYLDENDQWETLLDVDALADSEEEDWVFKGAVPFLPTGERVLIKLSRGGADATVVREFDVEKRAFVDDGFYVDEAKSFVDWIDRDTLLVATDFGEGSLTTSGYPAQVRRWKRGEDLSEAELVLKGSVDDVLVLAHCEHHTGRIVTTRVLDFYSSRTSVSTPTGMEPLRLPEDCEPTIARSWLFVEPRTAYEGIPAGGLGAIKLEDFLAGSRTFRTVFAPSEHTALRSFTVTENYLVMTVLDTVTTSIRVKPLNLLSKPSTPLRLPEMQTAHVVAANSDSDEVWIDSSSFTAPSTLYRVNLTESIEPGAVKNAPPRFDARNLSTRQHFAVSADGTRIPYFITGNFDLGPRPTLVEGYGGFEVSLTPGYSAIRGIGWLQRGNFYVQPNLRGGGEFGPEWHSQVTGLNRHKVWEDHEAVLRDIVKRGYAATSQIGIRGGSNGGLLTAGALTQYSDAFGAAVVQVPLIDMLRYHTWLAGASWMAEYGDPEDPVERAAIEKWSPLHNVSDELSYPPALISTSTRDDRVHPAHARLFAHALSAAGQPVDYFENEVGGHAGASDNEQVARVESLVFTWLAEKLASDS